MEEVQPTSTPNKLFLKWYNKNWKSYLCIAKLRKECNLLEMSVG